jgi:ATP-dependent DNA helicase RecG
VGPQLAARLAELGITSVGDLLEYFPYEHRDRRERKPVKALAIGETATVEIVVKKASVRSMRDYKRKRVDVHVADESGPMVCVWFNQPWMAKQLAPGTRLRLYGKLRRQNEFWVTEHEKLDAERGVHTDGLVPVYRAGQGVSVARIRDLCWCLLGHARQAAEPLPAYLRGCLGFSDRASALAAIHFPASLSDKDAARTRLAFEELFVLQVALQQRRSNRRLLRRACTCDLRGELVSTFRDSLAFGLTGDQLKACESIDSDLSSHVPMNRLLMGEVGSGKTVVAVHAMLRALEGGYQTALLAPTETLAQQHLATIQTLAGNLIQPALLTGSTPAHERGEIVAGLADGRIQAVVGTHALIETSVGFSNLGVFVVDEQHRFGVYQRSQLESKAQEGYAAHALHMTATPIPRTLSLTAYGDLDITTLSELPTNRMPVDTHIAETPQERADAYAYACAQLELGNQCFVVCPLVSESEALQAKAATEHARALREGTFRQYNVALIHGQLPAAKKEAAMEAFVSGNAQVLVATSVIEVGIDVPNATVMLVEAAERYGVSQLHQLRGRVGRGGERSVCVLFGPKDQPRLDALATHSNGFALADIDLELRGAGDVLGRRQHGLPQFAIASLPNDFDLLEQARAWAQRVVESDGELCQPEHALLKDAVVQRFGSDFGPIPA